MGSPEARSLRPAWATEQDYISTKNKKASWEAEVGESLEPGRSKQVNLLSPGVRD